MKKSTFILFFATLAIGVSSCQNASKSKPAKLESDLQKFSYTVGQQIGTNLKRQGLDLDIDAFALAVEDVFEDREARLDKKAQGDAMQAAMTKMQEKKMEDSVNNKATGETFLEENKAKEGVKVTDSGLQYKVITPGKGDSPKPTDTVRVHYRGRLIDGKEFDSSYKRNQPAEFPVNGVIAGWTEALQIMKPGAKWELYIPSDLAYGQRGTPGIPPASTLIFEVELLEVLDKAKKG